MTFWMQLETKQFGKAQKTKHQLLELKLKELPFEIAKSLLIAK
jgi:hypothetical protein